MFSSLYFIFFFLAGGGGPARVIILGLQNPPFVSLLELLACEEFVVSFIKGVEMVE